MKNITNFAHLDQDQYAARCGKEAAKQNIQPEGYVAFVTELVLKDGSTEAVAKALTESPRFMDLMQKEVDRIQGPGLREAKTSMPPSTPLDREDPPFLIT